MQIFTLTYIFLRVELWTATHFSVSYSLQLESYTSTVTCFFTFKISSTSRFKAVNYPLPIPYDVTQIIFSITA